MLATIQITIMLLLFYVLITVLLNFIQDSFWGGIEIIIKNKKIIGKEQPIYFINEERLITKYVIDFVDCDGLNFFFYILFPICFSFKKLDYTIDGRYYINEDTYSAITESDDLAIIYNNYFELENKKYLEMEEKLNKEKTKLKKLNEKFTLNYEQY